MYGEYIERSGLYVCTVWVTAVQYGRMALHYAASRGRVPMAEYLVHHGADINAKDDVRRMGRVSVCLCVYDVSTGRAAGVSAACAVCVYMMSRVSVGYGVIWMSIESECV